MRLVCPCCGAIASLEIWEADASMRQFSSLMASLPHKIQHVAPRYLGLFRKGDRGLSWKRALRLLQELKDLVAAGTVHWEGGETRPAPVELWAEMMEQMLDRGLKELDGHNYLRKTVWSEAKSLASKAESQREIDRRHRMADGPEAEPASEEDRTAVQEMLKQFTKRVSDGG